MSSKEIQKPKPLKYKELHIDCYAQGRALATEVALLSSEEFKNRKLLKHEEIQKAKYSMRNFT